MDSYGTVGWGFIEEAVIRDRGLDEEGTLASIVQSYFIRQGFVDSLGALNEELRAIAAQTTGRCRGKWRGGSAPGDRTSSGSVKNNANGATTAANSNNNNNNNNNNNSGGGDASGGAVLETIRRRKYLQLLCLDEQYEQAAVLLPRENLLKVKLLAMEAMKRAKSDPSAALLFLCETVGPMILSLSDATAAHHIYVDTLASIAGNSATEWSVPSPCSVAREVNESLLGECSSSALDVLLFWSDWQAMMRTTEESLMKGNFPFSMRTEHI